MKQQGWTHDVLWLPAAKPTNWIEGTQAVLRAKKGKDDKVLVATCTSANGKPPSVVSWETHLKGEAEYQEIRNPNGTVTVISRYRLVPSREDHQQSLACIVNYHMDRFRESLTLNVQCERGRASRAGTMVPCPIPTLTSPPSFGLTSWRSPHSLLPSPPYHSSSSLCLSEGALSSPPLHPYCSRCPPSPCSSFVPLAASALRVCDCHSPCHSSPSSGCCHVTVLV